MNRAYIHIHVSTRTIDAEVSRVETTDWHVCEEKSHGVGCADTRRATFLLHPCFQLWQPSSLHVCPLSFYPALKLDAASLSRWWRTFAIRVPNGVSRSLTKEGTKIHTLSGSSTTRNIRGIIVGARERLGRSFESELLDRETLRMADTVLRGESDPKLTGTPRAS